MTTAKLLQFKRQVESITYDDILANRFKDLTHFTSGADFGRPTLYVTFSMDVKVWKQLDKGQLYGIDLGNYLSRNSILNEYSVPTVSDRANAKDGRKTIRVEYSLKDRGGK